MGVARNNYGAFHYLLFPCRYYVLSLLQFHIDPLTLHYILQYSLLCYL